MLVVAASDGSHSEVLDEPDESIDAAFLDTSVPEEAGLPSSIVSHDVGRVSRHCSVDGHHSYSAALGDSLCVGRRSGSTPGISMLSA